jgi:hypothetical protein
MLSLCSRCNERQRRAVGQRWCKECHSAYVRDNRVLVDRSIRTTRARRMQQRGAESGIYFVECQGFIKIGISISVGRRYSSIRNSNPFPVRALGFIPIDTIDESERRESALHEQFRALHHRGERFVDAPAIREYIAANSTGWPVMTQCDWDENAAAALWDVKQQAS